MDKGEKNCPICGCTKHMYIGCIIHWLFHKNDDEKNQVD